MKYLKICFVALTFIVLTACNTGDTTAPVITLNPEFSANQILGGMIQLPSGTCVDDVDATCYVQTIPPTSWDGVTPGTYTWTLVAEDRAGNVAEMQVNVTFTLN